MPPLAYLKLLLSPWRYNNGQPAVRLEQRLERLYGDAAGRQLFLTSGGRFALELLLRSLNLEPGDEVIVQSFTCLVAVNPVVWAGLRPVFVDIDPTNFSADLASLEARLTDKTRVIVVQHSFGLPGHIEQVVALAHSRHILVVEDCAHALGNPWDGPKLGTYGDAAILSFGIEKTLSSKVGGALLVNNPDLLPGVEGAYAQLPLLPRLETWRWLLYPLFITGLRRLPASWGKPVSRALIKRRLLRQAVSATEQAGGRPPTPAARLSGALAAVILAELTDLERNLSHRSAISDRYTQALAGVIDVQLPAAAQTSLIRFPLLCATPELRDYLKSRLQAQGMPVSTWYDPAVFPGGPALAIIGYDPASVPVAEAAASHILCLPTGSNISGRYATVIANELIAATADFPGAAGPVSGPART